MILSHRLFHKTYKLIYLSIYLSILVLIIIYVCFEHIIIYQKYYNVFNLLIQ